MQFLLRTSERDIDCKSGSHKHFQQLIRIIKKRVGDDSCAELFAKPVRDSRSGQIDWYTDLPGEIVPYDSCSPEEQEEFWEELERINLLLDKAEADLAASSRPETVANGQRLSRMRNFPGSTEFLFCVGRKPVVAAWGCGSSPVIAPAVPLEKDRGEECIPEKNVLPFFRSSETVPDEAVSSPPVFQEDQEDVGVTPSLEESTPPPPPEDFDHGEKTPRRRGWIWWLLSFLLLVLICTLLFCRCSERKMILLDDKDVSGLFWEEDSLREEVNTLKRRLTVRWGSCETCTGKKERTTFIDDTKGLLPPAENKVEQRLREKLPNLPKAKISITLIWNGVHDLDLWAAAPGGKLIFFSNRADRFGGKLNMDCNDFTRPPTITNTPLENITWPESGSPAGQYGVAVNLYGIFKEDLKNGRIPFTLQVAVGNDVKQYTDEFVFTPEFIASLPPLLVNRAGFILSKTLTFSVE